MVRLVVFHFDDPDSDIRNFNSSMVRLVGRLNSRSFAFSSNFNSSMVRLVAQKLLNAKNR
ncbi:hypothetical protein NC99_30490 [Sunxiuqinia dokdonensis]|uniref:Uncharacterized protein n=1 Tax=Sunxiuqinia dokdonensis TaxID=1409788 RepID=A0A0L8V6I9_9BACT|nr:hypothetical protein NC99_30490 [Sunxiuqinia dokdonensis]